MTIEQFAKLVDLGSMTEVDRATLLSFFLLRAESKADVSIKDLSELFHTLHIPRPNLTRLRANLLRKNFMQGGLPATIRLRAKCIQELEAKWGAIISAPPELQSDGSILPDSLFAGKRSYIQRLAKQINACFSIAAYDGTAVLMRRLLEVCLIHVYENLGITANIEKASGELKELRLIIDDAEKNAAVGLTKPSKECMDSFRVLGNLSAHKLYYNCHREEIEKVRLPYRLLIEELFHKAGRKCES